MPNNSLFWSTHIRTWRKCAPPSPQEITDVQHGNQVPKNIPLPQPLWETLLLPVLMKSEWQQLSDPAPNKRTSHSTHFVPPRSHSLASFTTCDMPLTLIVSPVRGTGTDLQLSEERNRGVGSFISARKRHTMCFCDHSQSHSGSSLRFSKPRSSQGKVMGSIGLGRVSWVTIHLSPSRSWSDTQYSRSCHKWFNMNAR